LVVAPTALLAESIRLAIFEDAAANAALYVLSAAATKPAKPVVGVTPTALEAASTKDEYLSCA
jgi:hypothetical protein